MLATTQDYSQEIKSEPKLAIALIVAGIVFLAAFFGIMTRPLGFLAAVWPANAILLGMMVRNPSFATPSGWLAAFAGYLAADILTGGDFYVTLWLTLANITGAMTGYVLFRLSPESDRWLRRPVSVLRLFAICCAAASAAALAGGLAAFLLFGRDLFSGMAFWFITELVNSLIFLPVLLTFPGFRKLWLNLVKLEGARPALLLHAVPALALLASVFAGILVGGPGALAIPVPALLWCALTYATFTTSVLTMLLCTWLLISIPSNLIPLQELPDPIRSLDSIRLGIALMALSPLTVASINAGRVELIDRLSRAANFDALTGSLSRGAFMERGTASLAQHERLALLMLDIDHFKRINDRFGHAGGDQILKEFVALVSSVLRPVDLFGRMGGEEFAVVLPNIDLIAATSVAERIRLALAATTLETPSGEALSATVSIGVATKSAGENPSFDDLLLVADQALYEAKDAGRNMVRIGAAATARQPMVD